MSGDGDVSTNVTGGDPDQAACGPGSSMHYYAGTPEACSGCEEVCRQTCEREQARMLGSCKICNESSNGGNCGQCLKACLAE